jgi:hypothetical protein
MAAMGCGRRQGVLAALIWALVAGTGCGKRDVVVELVFPSKALAGATSFIEVELWQQTSSVDHCPRLRLDEQPTEQLASIYRKGVSFPFERGELAIGSLVDATCSVVVVAWNRATRRERFLRGCAQLAAGAKGTTVRVELAELRGCCRPNDDSCAKQTTIACYDAPEHTAGKGACKQGTSECLGLYFTSCVGQVLPQAETCNGLDDDCDGLVDNAPGCGTRPADSAAPPDAVPADGAPTDGARGEKPGKH